MFNLNKNSVKLWWGNILLKSGYDLLYINSLLHARLEGMALELIMLGSEKTNAANINNQIDNSLGGTK